MCLKNCITGLQSQQCTVNQKQDDFAKILVFRTLGNAHQSS